MTFQFTNVDFMFGILLDNKTAVEAGDKIALLKQHLAQRGFSFGTIIPVPYQKGRERRRSDQQRGRGT